MNVEQVLNSFGEIRGSLQSILVELRDELNRFRARLENDPSMSSMEPTDPRRLYLVNGRTEELLSNGTEETISRYAAVIKDHVDELGELETDLCELLCRAYQNDLLFVPPETCRLVARGNVPTDRDERFTYWSETLRATVVAGFEIESADDPFANVENAMMICDSIVQAIRSTSTPDSCDSNIENTETDGSAAKQFAAKKAQRALKKRPRKKSKSKGRPKKRDLKKDQKLVRDWESACRHGSDRSDFCRAKGISIKDLENAQGHVRRRKSDSA